MKKILSICLISMLTVFSVSCSAGKNSSPLTTADIKESFSCTASVTYGELQAQSTVKRFGKGMWENEFISPDTVAGVKLVFENDEITASYKGLEFSVPKSAVPFQSMLSCLIQAADEIYESDEIICSEKDGVLTYEGKLEQGDYEICFNAQSGFIQSFSMPNMELVIEFSDCSAAEPQVSADETSAPVLSENPESLSDTSLSE